MTLALVLAVVLLAVWVLLLSVLVVKTRVLLLKTAVRPGGLLGAQASAVVPEAAGCVMRFRSVTVKVVGSNPIRIALDSGGILTKPPHPQT